MMAPILGAYFSLARKERTRSRVDGETLAVLPWITLATVVELTPAEIAAEALACEKAGASILHLHVRDEKGVITSYSIHYTKLYDDRVRQDSLNDEVFFLTQNRLGSQVVHPAIGAEEGQIPLRHVRRTARPAGAGPRTLPGGLQRNNFV